MSGGLEALENIGKKTMEVLTEGDPGERGKARTHTHTHNAPSCAGFKNKRKLLKREAPSLSAVRIT